MSYFTEEASEQIISQTQLALLCFFLLSDLSRCGLQMWQPIEAAEVEKLPNKQALSSNPRTPPPTNLSS
jgi:hypothetical protein